MLIGRYTLSGEIDLEGDFDSLLQFSQVLSAGRESTTIPLLKADPGAYDALLESVSVETTAHRSSVIISRVDTSLVVRGPSEKLAVIADNVRFLVGQGLDPLSSIQGHIHIEYHEGHPYLAKDSQAVTISFLRLANG